MADALLDQIAWLSRLLELAPVSGRVEYPRASADIGPPRLMLCIRRRNHGSLRDGLRVVELDQVDKHNSIVSRRLLQSFLKSCFFLSVGCPNR
jgi:hypothetical protein